MIRQLVRFRFGKACLLSAKACTGSVTSFYGICFSTNIRTETTSAANGKGWEARRRISDPEKLEIVVSDNGIGLDQKRYDAFCEIDTDFKRAKGGKGVGRLFWLEAAEQLICECT